MNSGDDETWRTPLTACYRIPLHAPVRCVSSTNALITIEVSHMFIIPSTGVQYDGQGTGGGYE